MNKHIFAFLAFLLCSISVFPDVIISEDIDSNWKEETYILNKDVTLGYRVTITGKVTIFLEEKCHLTINGGIGVSYGNELVIDGTGYLTVNGTSDNAGIGGNGSSGIITINGGIIYAEGGSKGAGIGGGKLSSLSGLLTINGGDVTAIGGSGYSAGIGGGDGTAWAGSYGGCGKVVINGGIVHAESKGNGSGIGGSGGYGSSVSGAPCGIIEINGGKIYAKSHSGFALGGGYATVVNNRVIRGTTEGIVLNWNDPDSCLETEGKTTVYDTLVMNRQSRLPDTGTDKMTATRIVESQLTGNDTIVPLQYCDVKFVYGNNYFSSPDSEKTFFGSLLQKPEDIKLSDCTFLGWYKDRSLSIPWNFTEDEVKGNGFVYAKLIANEVDIKAEKLFNYTGSVITVEPQVYSKDHSITLKNDIDYKVSYKNSEGETVTTIKDVGDYTLLVTGAGDYENTEIINSEYKFFVIKQPSGKGTQEDPYIISNNDDWNLISSNLEKGVSYSGKYVQLNTGITVASPMGSVFHPFNGIFDGQNYSVSKTEDCSCVFNYIRNCVIKNIYSTLSLESLINGKMGTNTINVVCSCFTEKPEDLYETVSTRDGKTFYIGGTQIYNLEELYTLKNDYPVINILPVVKVAGYTLENNEDFVCTFTKKSALEVVTEIDSADSYTLTITGKGKYSGTVSKDFTVIKEKEIKSVVYREGSVNFDAEGSCSIKMPGTQEPLLTLDLTDETLYSKGYSFKIYDDGGYGGGFYSGTVGNFTKESEGYLKIIVPQGYLIQFSGYVATKSKYDFLTIYDGETKKSSTLVKEIYGENKENSYIKTISAINTSSNTALVYFRGWSSNTCEGLDLTATIVEKKSINANEDIYRPGTFYTSFYTEEDNYIAAENTRVFYLVREDNELVLKEALNKVIRKGHGVILESEQKTINLYSTKEDADYSSLLSGTMTDISKASDVFDSEVYVLSISEKGGVAFYKRAGNIPANKCFFRRYE